MFLDIECICSFNFPRIKKPMPILKYILTNLNLRPNNIPIPQSNILQLNLRLQNITITKLTISNIRFNTKYIIRTNFNYITLYLAICFYENYCFLFDYVVISEYYFFCFIFADYGAWWVYYAALAEWDFSDYVVVA